MSRVMLISPWSPPPDGVAFHSKSLVDSWRAAGHQVMIVTSASSGDSGQKGEERDDGGVDVVRGLHLVPRRDTTRLLSRFRPDVVVVQFAIASQSMNIVSTIALARAAHREGIPVVTAFHEPVREIDRLGPFSRWIYRQMERSSSIGVAYSSAGATALVASGLFRVATELPHGCSPVEVTAVDLARVRERYAITSPLIISLGFSHVDKGTDLLVEAMSGITQSLGGDVQFLLAGSPRQRRGIFRLMGRADRRFHERLATASRRLTGVSVEMSGYVPSEDVPALLHIASAVVLPYRRSTQSGVANQALAAGAVILASDIPGLKSDLGSAAHFFRSGSVADLVERSVSVLSNPQDGLREAARRRASERSYDVVAARLVEVGLSGVDDFA